MPCLSGRYQRGIGPLLNLGVTKPGVLTPGVSQLTVTTFPALIDTGASSSCISASVAQIVGLQPIGLRPMASATQSVPVNLYLVDLAMPFGNAGLIIPATQVLEFTPHGTSPFQVLVGRDIPVE